MAPRVLVSDELSETAVQIFRDRGIDVDVKSGISKDDIEKIIHEYDGLAVRSNTKVTEKLIGVPRSSRSSAAPASVSTISTSRRRPPRASS